MDDQPVSVLLIEDDEDDYVITRDLLCESRGMRFTLERVATYEAGRIAIGRNGHDVYLLDYGLGERNGLELLREVVGNGCAAPIILLTGQGDHETDVEAMAAGAADYLVKGQIGVQLLERSIRYALNRAKTLAALQKSEAGRAHAQRIARLGNWEWDLKTNDLECSDEVFHVCGLKPRKLKASPNPFHEVVHPDETEMVRQEYAKAVREHEPLDLDHRIVLPDGSERIIQVQGEVVLDRAGTPVRMSGTFQDITERKRYEEGLKNTQKELERKVAERTEGLTQEISRRQRTETALRENQQRLEAIAGNLFEGVLVVDIRGHIVFANPSAEMLIGNGKTVQLAGLDIDDLFQLQGADGKADFDESPFRFVAETGETVRDDDAAFITGSGTILHVAFACSPLLQDGKRRGAIISFRDIGELKEAQTEALQASKLASVGQLAAGIAHEINTPIQYIGDNIRFLGEAYRDIAAVLDTYRKLAAAAGEAGVLEDRVAEAAAAAEEADLKYLLEEIPAATDQSLDGVDQVSRIVFAMKAFSHPGSEEKTATDLNQAIENTLAVCRNEWKHAAEVDTDFDPALPPVVCHAGELNQVFLNLIVNAAHAIEETGVDGKGRITVTTRRDDGWVEIRVADTGGGIPEEIRDRIFDPFFTTKDVGKGTGQGLAICRDVVVKKQGGKIFFETQKGKGTAFVVRLPIDGQGTTSAAA